MRFTPWYTYQGNTVTITKRKYVFLYKFRYDPVLTQNMGDYLLYCNAR